MKRIKYLGLVVLFSCSLIANAQFSMEEVKTMELGKNFADIEDSIANRLLGNVSVFKGNLQSTYKIESPVTDSIWIIKKDRPVFDKYGDCKYTFKFANEVLIGIDIRFQFIALQSDREQFEELLRTMIADFTADKDFVPLKTTSGDAEMDLDKIITQIKTRCNSEAENENYSRKPTLLGSQAWELHKRVNNVPRHKLVTLQVHTAPMSGDYYSGCTAIVELSISNEQFINLYNQVSQTKIQYNLLDNE